MQSNDLLKPNPHNPLDSPAPSPESSAEVSSTQPDPKPSQKIFSHLISQSLPSSESEPSPFPASEDSKPSQKIFSHLITQSLVSDLPQNSSLMPEVKIDSKPSEKIFSHIVSQHLEPHLSPSPVNEKDIQQDPNPKQKIFSHFVSQNLHEPHSFTPEANIHADPKPSQKIFSQLVTQSLPEPNHSSTSEKEIQADPKPSSKIFSHLVNQTLSSELNLSPTHETSIHPDPKPSSKIFSHLINQTLSPESDYSSIPEANIHTDPKPSQKIFSQLISQNLSPQKQPNPFLISEPQQRSLASSSPKQQNISRNRLSTAKSKHDRGLLTPGPGEYNTETRSFSPSYSIGKSERFSTAQSTPGPADYIVNRGSKSPAYSIGKCDRVLLGEQIERTQRTPGPADYSPEVQVHSPSARLIGKPSENIEQNPGPGDYNTHKEKLYPKAAEYSIGRAARPDVVRNDYPGPSTYHAPDLRKSFTGSFTKSARTFKYSSDVPGPSFAPPSTLSTKGGVIGVKVPLKIAESPGPGHYSARDDSPSKSFSFGRSPKFPKEDFSPVGPTSYSPSLQKTRLQTRFSRSVRKDLFNNSSGSEGELRNRLVTGSTPGPGAYDPRVMSKSPVFTIGKSKRDVGVETSGSPSSALAKGHKSEGLKIVEYLEAGAKPPEVRKNNYDRIRRIKD